MCALVTGLFNKVVDSELIFSLFFSSLVSRPRPTLDGNLWNWPGCGASSHCHYAIIHPHVIHCSFMLFDVHGSVLD
jgi:hypothetical protein